MKKSELIKLAQAGHHQAISLLLNHSLKSHNIKATVGEHAGTLHILLESQSIPTQATYSEVIHQGLQKLAIASIDKAHIYGRATGNQAFAWKTIVSLRDNTILDQSQFTRFPSQFSSPQPPRKQPSSTNQSNTIQRNIAPPRQSRWRFWVSWLMASLVSSAIAVVIVTLFSHHLNYVNGITQFTIAAFTFCTVSVTGALVWRQRQQRHP